MLLFFMAQTLLAPGEECQEMFGLSFVSVCHSLQKGSGVTEFLGTPMIPII